MKGLKKPKQCPNFGRACVPEHPLGAPMVSSEGACAAYYRYRNHALAAGLSNAPAQEDGLQLSNQTVSSSGDVASHEFQDIQYVEIPDEKWTGTPKEMHKRADAIMRKFTSARNLDLGDVHFTGKGR